MTPKIKNIIMFVGIGVALILIYVFFIKQAPPEDGLVSSNPTSLPDTTDGTSPQTPPIAQDFLTLLLNVQNIELKDDIFSDVAFNNLRDSSIVLIPDGNEGRPNPFAPIGVDKTEQSPDTSSAGAE